MQGKSGIMALLLTLFVALLAVGQDETPTILAASPPGNSQIDFDGFVRIALEVQGIRESQRVSISKFTNGNSNSRTKRFGSLAK